MTDPIRTPLDERDEPGTFYLPFKEGWWYEGQTYPGHSSYSVDWNRRTATGGWLDDRGDPVLAAADGIVADIEPADGTVFLNHYDGLWRTEYRHMEPVRVKKGQRVERGDHIGDIGTAGNSTSPHLHHVHWRRSSKTAPWRRVQMAFNGEPLRVSVKDSDTKPAGWTPPPKVLLQAPPPKATWRSAFEAAAKRMEKAERRVENLTGQLALVTEERDDALRRLDDAQPDPGCQDALTAALRGLDESKASIEALTAERDGALERAQQEQERAERAEAELDICLMTDAADTAFLRAVEEALTARKAAT